MRECQMITFVFVHFDRLSAELLSFVFRGCENHVKLTGVKREILKRFTTSQLLLRADG